VEPVLVRLASLEQGRPKQEPRVMLWRTQVQASQSMPAISKVAQRAQPAYSAFHL